MESEQVFSHELARRSVARAALHLGIDSMSEEALDVLADVLMNHMERIGRAMSNLVESSGRTSAHTNVLDAIDAINRTTSPVVHQLHYYATQPENGNGNGNENDNDNDATSAEHHQSTISAKQSSSSSSSSSLLSWQDLASFCFGPKWKNAPTTRVAGGGKGIASETNSGWVAPYLDEVLHFPLASENCANPHPLGPHAAMSLHQHVTAGSKPVLEQVPDAVFLQNEWGGAGQVEEVTMKTDSHTTPNTQKGNKDKKNKEASTGSLEPNTKRIKTDDGLKDAIIPPTTTKHTYIPNFFPPFPDSLQHNPRTIVETEDTTADNVDDPTAVRSSLVELRHEVYWGGIDEAPVILPGRSGGTTSAGSGPPTTTINPLARASVNRVSKILEGSMDQMN